MHAVLVKSPRNFGVTPEEVHANCSLEHDEDDPLIAHQILAAAYDHVSSRSQRSLVLSQWLQYQDRFQDSIEIARGPLIQVDQVQYIDTSGTLQTLSSSDYRIDSGRSRPVITPALNKSWPSVASLHGAVQIKYTSGYGNLITGVDAGNNRITPTDHKFFDGQQVTLSNLAGALPTGLSSRTTYYVVGRDSTSIQLSCSPGEEAVGITAAGSGSSYIDDLPASYRQAITMLASYWYENREAFSIGKVHRSVGVSIGDLIDSSGGKEVYV